MGALGIPMHPRGRGRRSQSLFLSYFSFYLCATQLPFQTYNDAEKMAEAALKAKTQAAEACH